MAQRNIAQDITEQIPRTDIEFAHQIVSDCLADRAAGEVNLYSASAWLSGQWLYLYYSTHVDAEGRLAQYTAQFRRESPQDEWQLSKIIFSGGQILPGQNQPMRIVGFAKPETLQLVLDSAAKLWAASTSDPFEIVGITSNRLPPIYCETEKTIVNVSENLYEVKIRNMSSRRPPPSGAAPNTLTVGSYSPHHNFFSIRLTGDGRKPPISTEANCLRGNDCDPDLLSRLRESLDRPIDPSEIQNRLSAAIAVLPNEFRDARVQKTQLNMSGTNEHFNVQLEEVAVSPARNESSSVMCNRNAGSREDWNCQHMPGEARQVVGGQSSPVILMLLEPLSEADVEKIVGSLRTQLAMHPDLPSTNDRIRFSSIHAVNHGYQSIFTYGRANFIATFTYDGDEVRLDAVESPHQWNQDGIE